MKKDDTIDLGSVQVHRKVFAEIIASAMEGVDGASLIQKNIGNRMFEIFGKRDFPGINIEVDDNHDVTLSLEILVQYGNGAGAINCPISGGVCGAGSGSEVVYCTAYTDCTYPTFEPDKSYFLTITDASCQDISDQMQIDPIATCTDSDGGKDYYEKGTATGWEGNQWVTSTDGCRYDGKTLAEVYCDGSNLLVAQYECPNDCENGACVQESTCTDSDGGINYDERGTVDDGSGIVNIDHCLYA